jgi:hypothetical protein
MITGVNNSKLYLSPTMVKINVRIWSYLITVSNYGKRKSKTL